MTTCNPNLRVTWLTRRRLPRVVQIERLCFGKHAWTHEDFTSVLSQRSCIGMVVTDQADCVRGHVVYELHPQCMRILTIAVDPLAQRDGAGAAMIASLAGKLSTSKRTQIVTEVRETNTAARWFFQSMNFRANRIIESRYEGSAENAVEYVLTLEAWGKYLDAAVTRAAEEVAS